jgi:hypothetical protein
MGKRCGRLRLLAALLAAVACGNAAWGETHDAPSAIWKEQAAGRRLNRAGAADAPWKLKALAAKDARIGQIDPKARAQGREMASRSGEAEQQEEADFAEALTVAPDGSTAPELKQVAFPIIEDVPPVAYLQKHIRKDWVTTRIEPPLGGHLERLHMTGPCHGVCEQSALIFHQGRLGGADVAGIVQSGPNQALILQQAQGPASNIAFAGQWGLCNKALVAQAASAGVNTSTVIQSGYGNIAIVAQH